MRIFKFLKNLQELWQVREADDFPRLELVPDVHGKHLRILGSVVD